MFSEVPVVERLEPRSLLSGVAPDTTFGAGGVLRTDLRAWDVQLLADNRIVVANNAPGLEVVRLNADGTLDASFGVNGRAAGDAAEPAAAEMALAPDGKIVVAGSVQPAPVPPVQGGTFNAGARPRSNAVISIGDRVPQPMTYVLARYNADGTRDASFDGDGKAEFTVLDGLAIGALAVRPDGKVLLASGVSVPGRDSSDRDLATTYTLLDAAGAVERRWDVENGFWAKDAAVLPGGAVAVAGESQESDRPVQYRVFGDAAAGGAATWFVRKPRQQHLRYGRPVRTVYHYVNRAVAQPDGKLLLAGYETGLGRRPGSYAVARFLPGGAPDRSFGRKGVVLLKVPPSAGPGAYDVDVLPDGRIVVSGVGQSVRGGRPRPILFRLLPNGRPDATFGRRGRSDDFGIDPAGAKSAFSGVLIQSDGSVVLAESVGADWGDLRLVLSRYQVR